MRCASKPFNQEREMNRSNLVCGFVGVGFLLAGSGAAWAECPEGKTDAVLYTPSGNANQVCVSDNALPGIENANQHTLGLCPEVTCPCWDADTLDNLPTIPPQSCTEDYNSLFFYASDPSGFDINPGIAVLRAPDYYDQDRKCAIFASEHGSWGGALGSPWFVLVDGLSQTEADTCADILRASKWWTTCAEDPGILH